MKRLLLTLFTFLTLLTLPGATFAYSSNICAKNPCTRGEVGVFMEGISLACGNMGDCTLSDILLLFVNTGNYVVGLIGGIVLLMYIIGGVYFLTSAGVQERVTKGKKMMFTSTIGLLIVMFSYLGIYALKGSLQYGTFTVEEDYVVCTGTADTEKKPCDLNSTCVEGACVSECVQKHPGNVSFDEETSTATFYTCMDTNASDAERFSDGTAYLTTISCTEKNQCPGDEFTVCCLVSD